jgi:hypothetical protein
MATTTARTTKAQPAAKASTKAAPAKAQPTKTQSTKAAPAKAAPTPHLDRIGVAGPVKGYTIRWPHASYDLAKKDDKAAAGPDWIVVCNEHGTHTEASNAKEGDVLGGKAGRPAWCKACAKAAS